MLPLLFLRVLIFDFCFKLKFYQFNSSFQTCPLHVLFLVDFFFFFCIFRATPVAYEIYQARSQIEATAAGLHHSHSNVGSELCL